MTQGVVNTLVKAGVDPLTIATSTDVASSKDTAVFVGGSSVTTLTTGAGGQSGAITFGANDGVGAQPGTVVVVGDTRTPQLTAAIQKSIVIATGNVTIGNVTVGGGDSGSSNLIIQLDHDTVTVSGNVTLLPDGAVFVSGPGTLDGNFTGNSTLTVQAGVGGTKLRGDVQVQLVIQAADDGTKNLTVDGQLRVGGDIKGQGEINVTASGDFTVSTSGHVDSHIEVHGTLRISSNVSVDANVELKGAGVTSVNTSEIPHIGVVASCEAGHVIQFTIPNVATGSDLEKKSTSGIIWTHGSNTTTSQFACTIEFHAANGDKVTATVVGGMATGPARRLLSASDCNTATWTSSSLNYSTCGNPNSAVSTSSSPLLLLSLAIFSLLALLS